MRYPGAASTHAASAYWNHIQLVFHAASAAIATSAATGASHAAKPGQLASVPVLSTGALSSDAVGPAHGADRGAALPTVATQAAPRSRSGPQAPLAALTARAVIARGLPGGRLR